MTLREFVKEYWVGWKRWLEHAWVAALGNGTLVQTRDGYYGIITGVRTVALGNGCEEVLSEEDFSALKVLPLNIYQEGGESNFFEMLEGRLPTQQLKRRALETQLMVDDLNE